MGNTLDQFKHFLYQRFNLGQDRVNEAEVIEGVKKGIVFEGIKLWTLIFAIFVASIGLNVNSTAVIIGAMLISPLMGPILGVGLGAAVYDYTLIRKSLLNLAVAAGISVITSFIYFKITPLAEVQSELLARTTPTIWDVLIAFFGGGAGMIASFSKDKSNPIAGVAIATALMPPLCTAGFGLAIGRLDFFLGALYLFFINAVMIAISTFLVSKFVKFTPVTEANTPKGVFLKRIIILVTIVTVTPSIYLAYRLVKRSVYDNNINNFVTCEFVFPKTQVFRKEVVENQDGSRTLDIYLIGQPLDQNQKDALTRKLREYSVEDTYINILDISDAAENNGEENVQNFRKFTENFIRQKDQQIDSLKGQIELYRSEYKIDVADITREMNIWLGDKIEKAAISRSVIYDAATLKEKPVCLVTIKSSQRFTPEETEKLKNYITQKLNIQQVELSVYNNE